jgi:hypothetical protein
MNFSKLVIIVLFAVLSQNSFATSAQDVKSKAGQTADAAADYTKEQKDAFMKEMQSNLATLKAKVKEMKSKAGQKKDENVTKLEKEQKNMEHDLAAMKKSSGKAWDQLKSGMSKAWDDVKSSMKDASTEMKK